MMQLGAWYWLTALLFVCLSPTNAQAADASGEQLKTAIECRWTDTAIDIDGRADEAVWQTAHLIEQFSLPWLDELSRPAKTATKARLLWDRENLYFLAKMDDADLYADIQEQDGELWNNDVFELFFKPAGEKPGYYEFQVSAGGTVLDMFLPRRNAGGYARFKKDGQFHLQTKVVLNGTLNHWQDRDSGWTVEGRIPWTDFMRSGGRPTVGEEWRFTLCRYDYSIDFEGPELSTAAPISKLDFHRYEDYLPLIFKGPSAEQAGLPSGLKPYAATSRVVGSPDPPPPYLATRVLPDLKLSWPISVVCEPGSDRLWIIDQVRSYGPARIARTANAPASATLETMLTIDDGGVAYDLTFHPSFERNGYIYVGANSKFGGDSEQTRITRYTVNREAPFELDVKSAVTIIEWPSNGHNGGAMVFGSDGMLYVTSGDGTSDSDADIVGQDLSKLTAKVLRIDVDHSTDGRPYSIPPDNPFIGVENARPETWAYGLRNPWRITVDEQSGQIWVGNNGQDLWEQVYLIERGANYGWSVYEGSHPFYPRRTLGPTPVSKPALEHHHSEARSLTGGVVYHGSKLPELRGAYIYGDYSTGKIWGVKHDGERVQWHRELADTTLQITAFALDAEGELLIADHQGDSQGGFYTLEPNPAKDSDSLFPRRLSDSGLFRHVAQHEMAEGVIPYSVNSPLWSDGAHKQRYLALPPTMLKNGEELRTQIDFNTSRSWDFPDRTVLVKSFALELEAGNPDSRRWIETRFLTKQQGEWVGYSYEWNDEQTDAELVDAQGSDRSFTIRSSEGNHQQAWHYPSRAECMICHTRAANFVLGLSSMQLNKQHDYGDHSENQLAVLERLKLLRVDWAGEAVELLRRELEDQGHKGEERDRLLAASSTSRDQRRAPTASLLFRSPEKYNRLPNPMDQSQSLDGRARSYLQANCAQCHTSAGGGNAQIDLAFGTSRGEMRIFDVKPQHHSFDIEDPQLISPGDAERSVLLYRMSHRGAGQMPPIATTLVDQKAVQLLRDWIDEMERMKPSE